MRGHTGRSTPLIFVTLGNPVQSTGCEPESCQGNAPQKGAFFPLLSRVNSFCAVSVPEGHTWLFDTDTLTAAAQPGTAGVEAA